MAAAEPETEAEFERAFRKAGLPLLIEDYSASEDIFNRAVPLLGLVLVAELLGPLSTDFSTAGNIAAVLAGLLVLLLAMGTINRLRGRPFGSLPRRVGQPELIAFVVVPALLPGLISGHWGIAALTALFNLGLLLAILGVVGFGLISIVGWVMTRLLDELSRSLGLLVRAVPLLLIFSLILFLTPELWEIFSQLPDPSLLLLVGLFVLLGCAFLIARIPREVEELERSAGATGPPLRRRQRVNVGLVLFVSQSFQVLLVAFAVAGFFVVFGTLTIDAEMVAGWTGDPAVILVEFPLAGRQAQLTEELLRVAAAMASFTGLYFAISMLTDNLYRQEFLSQITDEMKQTFARRIAYLDLLARERPGPP